MEYVFETKLRKRGKGVSELKSESGFSVQPKASICFDTDYPPDPAFPTLIFIHADGVKYKRNKVSFNGHFIGYLSAVSDVTMLEVDNRVSGSLMHLGNQISILPCDFWGNCDPDSWLNLDNFEINVVQVAYSRDSSASEEQN